MKSGKALTYLNEVLHQATIEQEIFHVSREYHTILRRVKLKAATEKSFSLEK